MLSKVFSLYTYESLNNCSLFEDPKILKKKQGCIKDVGIKSTAQFLLMTSLFASKLEFNRFQSTARVTFFIQHVFV